MSRSFAFLTAVTVGFLLFGTALTLTRGTQEFSNPFDSDSSVLSPAEWKWVSWQLQ
ncbi:hypothetical protein [Synechococcus sp. PCC 7336]|uniref:hypothetical protein n=1 Tax=Synechococcus sp. PCC 7336 TaxID=195250 RepID=UPI00034C4391|nr:hypothetical protein [Synechococcus sp. PCC 7336]